MRYINLVLAILMGASLALAALAEGIVQGPVGNYTIVDIHWEVPISPTRNDTVTGTVEDVIRHLQIVAPEILEAKDISAPGPEPTGGPVPVPFPFGDALVKTPDPNKVMCNLFQHGAKMVEVVYGMRYLAGIQGKPTNGPGSCGQVSCSWDSAIWWCNGNSYSLTLDSWGMVADGAGEVVDTCNADLNGKLNGQSFYGDGWSVMVKGGNC